MLCKNEICITAIYNIAVLHKIFLKED